MGSLAAAMRDIDAEIFAALGEVLLVGSERIAGVFVRRHREIPLPNGTVVGVELSFDCQRGAVVDALQAEDAVSVEISDGLTAAVQGPFRFIRHMPRGGDETGLVILELGEFK